MANYYLGSFPNFSHLIEHALPVQPAVCFWLLVQDAGVVLASRSGLCVSLYHRTSWFWMWTFLLFSLTAPDVVCHCDFDCPVPHLQSDSFKTFYVSFLFSLKIPETFQINQHLELFERSKLIFCRQFTCILWIWPIIYISQHVMLKILPFQPQ